MRSVLLASFSSPLFATDSAEEIVKKLSNPVAAMISLPVKFNVDENIGADDKGSRSTITIQLMQFGANVRYWVDSPDSGSERIDLTFDV